jgi:hypothetical protein
MSSSCRFESGAVEEPLGGTAPERVAAWLLVEHGGPWGREVPAEALSMPARERAALLDVQRRVPGVKVVFTRRGGLGPQTSSVALARPSGPSSAPALPPSWMAWPRRVAWRLDDPASLMDLVEALEGGPDAAAATALSAQRDDEACPRWLACTHGTRDACCARWGRALLPELERAGTSFRESSHLGGHRFAPVVLDLETGVMLGRLESGEAYDTVQRAVAGRLPELSRWRGRTTLSRFEQAAELFVRSLGIGDDPHAIHTVTTSSLAGEGPDTVAVVGVRARDGSTLSVRARWSEPRWVFGSCGDEARTAFRSVVIEACAPTEARALG